MSDRSERDGRRQQQGANGGRRGASGLFAGLFGRGARGDRPSRAEGLADAAPATPTAFRDDPVERERLDWRLLESGAVTLYHRPTILSEDSAWLRANGYRLHVLEAIHWTSGRAFFEGLYPALGLPDHFAKNLAGWLDALAELDLPPSGCLALEFRHFDSFARADRQLAQAVLDAIESTSRRLLLTGRRLIALVQCDDARIRFERIGAVPVNWNPREWLDADRGVGAGK